jgi:predicted metal-dependent phosphoesterase TrpH
MGRRPDAGRVAGQRHRMTQVQSADRLEDGERGDAGTRSASRRPGDATVRIDYHVHTCWSFDSEATLESLVDRALAAGLTRLCVTDHDTIDGAIALKRIAPPDLDVIVGCEFSTDDGSQIIGLDLKDMIPRGSALDLMHMIKEQGGLTLIPHPFRRGHGIFRPEMKRSESFVRSVLSIADMVECFNGRDSYANNRRSLDFAVRHGLPAVAGTDAHTAEEVGSVYVEYARDDERHGRSARRIYFADRRAVSENALKRTALEFYHRHEARWPAVVGVAYRAARERSGRDRAPLGRGIPRIQYDLPDHEADADGS